VVSGARLLEWNQTLWRCMDSFDGAQRLLGSELQYGHTVVGTSGAVQQ